MENITDDDLKTLLSLETPYIIKNSIEIIK